MHSSRADVAPYELTKLRILNGSHSTLAYHGALAGYETIAETVTDERLLDIARRLIREDVIPGLVAPDGTDLLGYGDTVLHRFENPALAHRTVQIAMDGSQKLPLRLLGTIRTGSSRAAPPGMPRAESPRGWPTWPHPWGAPVCHSPWTTRWPTGWRHSSGGEPTRKASSSDLLAVEEIFGSDLPDVAWFRDELVSGVDELLVRS